MSEFEDGSMTISNMWSCNVKRTYNAGCRLSIRTSILHQRITL